MDDVSGAVVAPTAGTCLSCSFCCVDVSMWAVVVWSFLDECVSGMLTCVRACPRVNFVRECTCVRVCVLSHGGQRVVGEL